MTKRILALALCIVMICSSLFACAKKDSGDMGAYITMYLTDEIYDFDPAKAYYNSDTINVLSMMYDTLFKLDEKGKVKKSLVDSYKIVEDEETNEYYIEFTLKEAYWNVKDRLTAEHVVFAWKRLVDFRNGFEAASLLFDIKNARAIKEGDMPIDDLGVEAVESSVVKVSFEKPIDYDQFLLNLTSVATAPLLDRFVLNNPDWAKKASTIATSGPFKLGKIRYDETGEKATDDYIFDKEGNLVPEGYSLNEKTGEAIAKTQSYNLKKIAFFYLERNLYYFRDTEHDSYDKSVKPYRLLVDCTKSADEILDDFKNGKLFYIGDIPLSLRTGDNAQYILDNATITDALSTFSIELNQNALIDDGARGTYLFANETVRKALSTAIDREAIANAVVFAKAADAFVSYGIFDEGTKGEFRTSDKAKSLITTSANVAEAKNMLSTANIDASKYTFSIKVAAYDDVHVKMTEMICEAWKELGFNVSVELVSPIQNNDFFKQTGSVPPDVCDDLFVEDLQRGTFEAIALDVTAYSADAYSMLSNYAYSFSGFFYADVDNEVYAYDTHITGYNSVAYNILMEAIYYIPYFASIDTLGDGYIVSHLNTKPYEVSATATMNKLDIAIKDAAAALDAYNKTLNPEDETVKIDAATVNSVYTQLKNSVNALETAVKTANKDIVAANCAQELLDAVNSATNDMIGATTTALNAINAAEASVNAALKATSSEDKKTTLATALENTKAALTAVAASGIVEKATVALEKVTAAKSGADQQTLKAAIENIYADNGITPSNKKADWKKQKSTLLHKAEELLMNEMPVIPVVYNQNAVLIHEDLSKVEATYYVPAYFRKTKLKNYEDYFYYSEEDGKEISIFKGFPEAEWDKIGR